MKILIIEDDDSIISLLKDGFEEENFSVDTAQDGMEGEYLATVNTYDIIILDWMLPLKNGIEVMQAIRNNNVFTPIIMLTAKDEIKDKITGLKNGADDYLAKPFSFQELQARIEAVYRRTSFDGSSKIQIKNIEIDTNKKIVTQNDKVISLSAREYDLLIFLIKNKNSYVSKFMIEDQLWSDHEFVSSNVIEVTIYNLRKKLSKDFIKNFKGLGYKIETK